MTTTDTFVADDQRMTDLGIDPTLFHATDALKQEITADESATEDKKQRLAEMMEELVEQFAMAGLVSIFLNGRAGSMRPQLYAAKAHDAVTTEMIIAALRASGLDHLISEHFNWNSLSSYVREKDAAGEELPPALAEVIQVIMRTKIGFSKGTAIQRRAAARNSSASHRPSGDQPGGGESPA